MHTSSRLIPFTFDNLPLRGKLLRLTQIEQFVPTLNQANHAATETLLNLLAAATIMQHDFKQDSSVTVQIQSAQSGAIMFARCNSQNQLRAYANTTAQEQAFSTYATTDGLCAVTVESAKTGHDWQSMVPLEHQQLQDALIAFFEKSAQTPTVLRVWAAQEDAGWQATALFLQALPPAERESPLEDWERIPLLLNTVTTEEALTTAPATLLHRLFNEDAVRLYPMTELSFNQENPRERMAQALQSIGQQACADLLTEGPIEMRDDTTGKTETFSATDIATLFAANKDNA